LLELLDHRIDHDRSAPEIPDDDTVEDRRGGLLSSCSPLALRLGKAIRRQPKHAGRAKQSTRQSPHDHPLGTSGFNSGGGSVVSALNRQNR